MAKFVFKSAVNVDKFDYAALINGTFSDQTDTSFTVMSGNDVVNVTGVGFVYSDGTPIDGTIEDFTFKTDGSTVLKASGLELAISQLATDFANGDAKALQADLFGGKDIFVGSDERDAIYGYDGNDNIRGHGGADLIVGGRGTDHLHGDEGGDTFRFESIADSRVKAPDTIFDLGGNDRVDLHKIDADVGQDGDQDFTLVANFTGHAGQMTLAYNPELDRTSLMLDVDGDGQADSTIYMMGDQTSFSGIIA
jgi:Ca2+-binding RTX toxin-like protein